MGFFTALAPLLAQGPLSIRVSQDDGAKVKLLIIQEPIKEQGGGVLLPPLKHVDTPEGLDATLEAEIAQLVTHRDGPVKSVLEQAKAIMDEAAAEEKRAAEARMAKARKPSAAAKSTGAKPASAGSAFSLDADSDTGTDEEGEDGASDASAEVPPAAEKAAPGGDLFA